MNYRHGFHAGNHADVFKHSVLALILSYLSIKDKSWRFIDTHAGRNLYDLTGQEAVRSPEWRDGIDRVFGKPLDGEASALLDPYLSAVRATNPDGTLRFYPGSPAIARALARPQDRLTFVELHPGEFKALASAYDGDRQVKTIAIDGWLAAGSFVPPKERRGLMLMDPPFEVEREFDRLTEALEKAHRRWSDGIYALWHPVKDLKAISAYEKRLKSLGIPGILRAELTVRRPTGATLDGSGLVIVNPPYTLAEQLRALLPSLARRLAQEPGGGARIDWLTADR